MCLCCLQYLVVLCSNKDLSRNVSVYLLYLSLSSFWSLVNTLMETSQCICCTFPSRTAPFSYFVLSSFLLWAHIRHPWLQIRALFLSFILAKRRVVTTRHTLTKGMRFTWRPPSLVSLSGLTDWQRGRKDVEACSQTTLDYIDNSKHWAPFPLPLRTILQVTCTSQRDCEMKRNTGFVIYFVFAQWAITRDKGC